MVKKCAWRWWAKTGRMCGCAVMVSEGLEVIEGDREHADVCQSCKAPTLIDATTLGLVSPPPYKGHRSSLARGRREGM